MRNKYIIIIVIILSLLLSPLALAASYPSNIYTVVAKDTLSKIAIKYTSTVQELKTLNGLQTDMLLIGQKLSVPITYSVVPGDTL